MPEPNRTSCILNPEQFAFMQSHHSEVEHGMVALLLHDTSLIDAITESEGYKAVLGDMDWDNAVDRYEETPGYDNSLRLELLRKLNEDVEAGRVELP